ncbi:MAG: GNAT family N-acetyltransferase [Xanthomonadaceae bacterium]|nr:GNAT family N-acetyltransferase [Xanthomonadaceae bacterium]MDE2256765.1 GNAT family N-acetyltransferase [Xanthomonadaceae bacterium]
MIPTDFTIATVDWNNDAEREACRAVREQVFIVEQNVPREDEWDDLDAASRHVLARDLAGNPIGTGRLVPPRIAAHGGAAHESNASGFDSAQASPDLRRTRRVEDGQDGPASESAMIGRMAVLRDWRGKHVGEAIMHLLIEQAGALGYRELGMHAQSHALPFYEKFGFAKYGDEFEECAISHFHMRRELEPAVAPERAPLPPRPDVRNVAVESRDQALDETLRLIGTAKRELCIYTRVLDPDLFESEAALEALKRVAISGRGASIRILVQDPHAVAARGHRLLPLAQRLTSVFALRTPVQDDDLHYPSAFLLNDVRGYYFRVLGNRFEGEAVNYAPGRHAQLLEYFNQVWERSEISEDLRQLAL